MVADSVGTLAATLAHRLAPRVARASAPGKLILMGEHSVVYGRPAVAAAVQRRLHVRATTLEYDGEPSLALRIDRAPSYRVLLWREVMRIADEAAPAGTRRQRRGHFLALVALREAARLLDATPPSLMVEIRSEIPAGHGMGSSAALAAATIAAVVRAAGEDVAPEAVEAAAHAVERRQHGAPSGLDGAVVVRGGVLEAAKPGAGTTPGPSRFRPLAADPAVLDRFRAYDTGCPRHHTGEVVAAVRRRLEADPALEAEVEGMGRLAADFARALVAGAEPDVVDETVRAFEQALEALGVVPPAARRLIRRIEREGGTAKISGAGGLIDGADGLPGAGMLLIHHEDPDRIAGWSFLSGLRLIDGPLGGRGLEVVCPS